MMVAPLMLGSVFLACLSLGLGIKDSQRARAVQSSGQQCEASASVSDPEDHCLSVAVGKGYTCTSWKQGKHGGILKCGNGGHTVLVKYPIGDITNNLAELIDEQRVMSTFKSYGFQCYAKDQGWGDVWDGFPCLAIELIDGMVEPPEKVQGISPATATRIFTAAKATGVKGHDRATGNFVFNANPACPITLIDVPQYNWENGDIKMKKGGGESTKSSWYLNCCKATGLLKDQTNRKKECKKLLDPEHESEMTNGCGKQEDSV